MNRLIIIDGNSLINRAYYAMQNPMMTKEGIYTQGIFGFLNMLSKIQKEYNPTHMAVAFDLKGPTFRHEEFKEYKAGRKKMPPELAMQIPLLKEILDAKNIKRLEKEGFEADDIIGTVAKKAEENLIETYIITGDKDELQLATDLTKIIFTKKGVSVFEIFDKEKMIETYGFTPEQFIDYKGLMGDKSDNIPGIPGVGEKTASNLILEFGSIENLLENTDKISKENLKNKISENKQLAIMSKRLATINKNVPINIDFDEFTLTKINEDKLISLYRKLEFNKFLKELGGEETFEPIENKEINIKEFNVEILKNKEDIFKLKNKIGTEKELLIKVLGDSTKKKMPQIKGLAIGFEKDWILYYIDMYQININDVIKLLNENECSFIGHNIKDDIYMLLTNGLNKANIAFDSGICQYLIDSTRSNYDIETMAAEYFQGKIQSLKDYIDSHGQVNLFTDENKIIGEYFASWGAYVFALKNILEKEIEKEDMEELFYKVELPLIEPLASMEKEGFALDRDTLSKIGLEIGLKIDTLTKEIHNLVGEDFNINSPSQLGVILFEKLGLPSSKKTKTGYSTGAEILEKLRDKHEIIPYILEYRKLTKLKGTYVDGLIPLIHEDGKIHANFMQTVTTTGRLSCIEPNLQNIPIRQELGRTVRKAFVPSDENYILIGADYSQIELRVLAHMSGDESLIEAFNNNEDIHKVTASRVLEIPQDKITAEERSKAKAVNFGVIYGMSSFGLSTEINVSRKEAENYINDYFKKHKKVREFMDGVIDKGKNQGYVTTILNRRRYIKEIHASNFMVRQAGERLAMNSPIQGSAADIIKIAMNKVYYALKEGNFKSKLILQIHDELIIETHKEELEEVKKLLKTNMEEAMSLKVKLAVEVNEGNNWYELK